MAVNTTNFDYALKTLWPQNRVQDCVYKDNPLLAMLPKDEKFGGANLVLAVRYADPNGRSATFATAQTNKSNHAGKKFTLTRVSDYSLASLSGEVIKASMGDENALISALDTEMSSAMNAIRRSLAVALYRNGTGSIGARSGALSGDVLTLTVTDDVTNFEPGMKIVASATDGGALRAGTAATIDAVDRDAGTLTSTTWGNITGFAASDFLYVEGDAANGGANKKISGLASWIPSTAPGATLFFGVDRTADVSRLGGVRVDISTLPIEEGLVKTAMQLGREGGSPDYAFMNYAQFTNLEHALGAKLQYTDLKVGELGFRAIVINGPKGPIKVIPDQNCPLGRGYMLTMDTLKLYSLGAAPQILDFDGNKLLRESSSDAYEVRIGYYAQLGCDAPGYNAVMTMPT